MNIFIELSIVLAVATVAAAFMRVLRQPLVVGYILAGVVVGPYVIDLVQNFEYIELFSKFGIAILLFIVGINLNPESVKEVGKVSVLAGVGQVVFTSVAGYIIVLALGFSSVSSIYIAIALTFSSTIIILKLLSDKGDLGKLYGKIAIGILLVQDIVATIILLFVSAIGGQDGGIGANPGDIFFGLIAKGILLAVIFYLASRYLLPKIAEFLASSQELLFLFAISWGLGLASLFYAFGFSIEIGALLAGVSLSVSPFAYEISSRMKSLRDFFIVLFFVLLGSQIEVSGVGAMFVPAVILSLFVLVGNPIIVYLILNFMGYRRKPSFQAGLTVAQISEFSLILMGLAYAAGFVEKSAVNLVTLVGVITIAISSYLIIFSDRIYRRVEWFIKIFDRVVRPGGHAKSAHHHDGNADMIIFGYDRVGHDFVTAAERISARFMVVDFSPQAIRKLDEHGLPYRFGDAEDVEFLDDIGIGSAKLIVSTIPDFEPNITLVKTYRRQNQMGIIIVLSHDVHHAQALYLAGASYVVMPHYLGAHHASHMIEKYGFDPQEFDRERNLHLNKLARRES